MLYFMVGGEKCYFDYTLLDNNSRPIFFKYNSRKRLKKELRSIFDTNSLKVIENRLKKYDLKINLIRRFGIFDYYEIVNINTWGGCREIKKSFEVENDL